MDASERRRRAAEEAAEWWVRLQGEPPRADREQFVDWLRESAVHVAEMLRVAQVHGALSQFERWGQLSAEDAGTDDPSSGSESESWSHRDPTVIALPGIEASSSPAIPAAPPRPPTHTRRSMLLWATAASVLVAVGVAIFLVASGRGQIIETQRGERREIALADGSVVQVDPETRLKVDYEVDARRVYLLHGRALFHVAKNPGRPFFVRADGTTVRAVGTAFAVEQAPSAVVVTVAEGKVAVVSARPGPPTGEQPVDFAPSAGTAASKSAIARRAPLSPKARSDRSSSMPSGTSGTAEGEIFLTANEQVTVAESGAATAVREVDSQRELAWAEGRLIFENEPVERAVREFNRYNRIQITVNDEALAHRSITGVFSASDPESFVAFIQTVAAVRVRYNATTADIAIEVTR